MKLRENENSSMFSRPCNGTSQKAIKCSRICDEVRLIDEVENVGTLCDTIYSLIMK